MLKQLSFAMWPFNANHTPFEAVRVLSADLSQVDPVAHPAYQVTIYLPQSTGWCPVTLIA